MSVAATKSATSCPDGRAIGRGPAGSGVPEPTRAPPQQDRLPFRSNSRPPALAGDRGASSVGRRRPANHQSSRSRVRQPRARQSAERGFEPPIVVQLFIAAPFIALGSRTRRLRKRSLTSSTGASPYIFVRIRVNAMYTPHDRSSCCSLRVDAKCAQELSVLREVIGVGARDARCSALRTCATTYGQALH